MEKRVKFKERNTALELFFLKDNRIKGQDMGEESDYSQSASSSQRGPDGGGEGWDREDKESDSREDGSDRYSDEEDGEGGGSEYGRES